MKKFNIHFSFICLLVFSILLGFYKYMLSVLICFFIHELGHLIFIKIFNYKVLSFTLFPYGGVINYREENDFIYKLLFICLGGVILNFLFYIIFSFLDISLLKQISLYFVIINLIPINPLDGGRIFILLLSYFLPKKISMLIGYILSIFAVLEFFIFLKIEGIFFYFTAVLILKENVCGIIHLHRDYKRFLLLKYLNPNDKLIDKETKVWLKSPVDSLYMGKNMIFNYSTFKIKEAEVLKKYYKNKKD